MINLPASSSNEIIEYDKTTNTKRWILIAVGVFGAVLVVCSVVILSVYFTSSTNRTIQPPEPGTYFIISENAYTSSIQLSGVEDYLEVDVPNATNYQKWEVIGSSNGCYYIINFQNGKAIDYSNADLLLPFNEYSPSQQWCITAIISSYSKFGTGQLYTISSSNYCLTLNKGERNLVTGSKDNSLGQQFSFKRFST
jgi:hypothetical protein